MIKAEIIELGFSLSYTSPRRQRCSPFCLIVFPVCMAASQHGWFATRIICLNADKRMLRIVLGFFDG